jgi:hypothetical protein
MSAECLQFAADYAEVNAIAHDSASDDEVAGNYYAIEMGRDGVVGIRWPASGKRSVQ